MHSLPDMGLVSAGGLLDDLSSLGILESVPLEDLGVRKVRDFTYLVDWRVVDNRLLICNFLPWNNNQKVEIVKAVTGWDTTA